MSSPIKIQVFRHKPVVFGSGDKGEAETAASVSLVRRQGLGTARWPFDALPSTHSHVSKGYYAPDLDEPGHWLLSVSHSGASPIVQRLTVTRGQEGLLTVRGGWDEAHHAQHTAATVTILAVDHKPGSDRSRQARRWVVQVRLFRRREAVIMSGHKYRSNDLPFPALGIGRRNTLYELKIIDDGSIVTLFDCENRARRVFVKARAARRWVTVDEQILEGSPDDEERPTVGYEYTIRDLYRHLHLVGAAHPGSVVETSILSHGFRGGPILFNSDDEQPDFVNRFPPDADGRVKDWVPTTGYVDSEWPLVAKAFSPEAGTLRVWGCLHVSRILIAASMALTKLSQSRPRDEFFVVHFGKNAQEPGDDTLEAREHTTLEHLRREIIEYVQGSLVSRHQLPKKVGSEWWLTRESPPSARTSRVSLALLPAWGRTSDKRLGETGACSSTPVRAARTTEP